MTHAAKALQSTRQWEPVTAPLSNGPHARNPYALREVLAQFDVERNPRYAPQKDDAGRIAATYCNIFSWDATRALQCEIPHWVPDGTLPTGRRELNANATLEWLEIVGPSAGWHETDARRAAELAAEGHPCVVLWRNPSGKSGHIAVLLAGRGSEVRIAQAGRRCLFDVELRAGFGAQKPLRWFAHA